MVDKAKFLVCPKCGAEILKEIAEEKVICGECEVPYVDEEKLAKARAELAAKAKAKEEAVAKARAELDKALKG